MLPVKTKYVDGHIRLPIPLSCSKWLYFQWMSGNSIVKFEGKTGKTISVGCISATQWGARHRTRAVLHAGGHHHYQRTSTEAEETSGLFSGPKKHSGGASNQQLELAPLTRCPLHVCKPVQGRPWQALERHCIHHPWLSVIVHTCLRARWDRDPTGQVAFKILTVVR